MGEYSKNKFEDVLMQAASRISDNIHEFVSPHGTMDFVTKEIRAGIEEGLGNIAGAVGNTDPSEAIESLTMEVKAGSESIAIALESIASAINNYKTVKEKREAASVAAILASIDGGPSPNIMNTARRG